MDGTSLSMASTAELQEREPAAAGRAARAKPPSAPAPAPSGDLVFRPEVFFLGRTEGAGVVRDPFGRVVRRCAVTTEGVFNAAYRAIHFDETFAYDDGEVDVWRWAMTSGADGRYVAAEAMAGAGIVGERRGGDYLISFRRPVGKAQGWLSPRFSTRFTLLSPELALKRANVSLAGLPLGILTAVHRRIES